MSSQKERLPDLLKRWWNMKQEIKRLNDEESKIKERIKKAMVSRKLGKIRGGDYSVTYREISRDTLARKDCPPDVWAKYSRKITYPSLRVDFMGESLGDEGYSSE